MIKLFLLSALFTLVICGDGDGHGGSVGYGTGFEHGHGGGHGHGGHHGGHGHGAHHGGHGHGGGYEVGHGHGGHGGFGHGQQGWGWARPYHGWANVNVWQNPLAYQFGLTEQGKGYNKYVWQGADYQNQAKGWGAY